MPIPRYIICCETRLVDKATSLVTHCNVIDGFAFAVDVKSPPPADQILFGRLIATAVWMREDADEIGDEYEYEFRIHKPGEEPKTTTSGTFKFSRRFQRIEQGFLFSPTNTIPPGIHFVESRIRRVGSDDWLSQKFPFTVELIKTDSAAKEEAEGAEQVS